MSITISNYSEICNAPTNQSSAKMLYTFGKQNRFEKRKTIMYVSLHSDVIKCTNSKTPFQDEEPPSAMDTSTTSPKTSLNHLLPIPTISMTPSKAVPRKDFLLDKVEKE